jgi:excisionase family DNA binding protein
MQPNSDRITGAKAIAFELGCSIDTVYRMAADKRAPIYKPGGRYFAFRNELQSWQRTTPDGCQILPDLSV